jgi:DNA polymerase-1
VVADYSQIELRAAAAIAGERKMIESYKAGEDLHRKTAAAVLCLERDEVTKSDRQLAKAVNFGLLYGQSAPGLMRYAASSYGVSLSEGQAQEIRKAFFRTYTKLRQWHARCRQDADYGEKEARTRLGRRRLIPGNASSWERFTARVNMPVQGGTADGMKQAIILVAQRIPEGAHLVATVHDELVVECREEDAEAVKKIVTDSMTEAMAELFPEVPIEVEANICSNWGEK